MMHTSRRAIALYAGLVIASLFITNCGGGGGSTAPSNAPVVSDFQILPLTPEKAFTVVLYWIWATVTDPNNDLFGGRVEIRDPVTGQIASVRIDGDILVSNTITVFLSTNPVSAGRYIGVFSVIDAAGNRSNEILFFVTIQPEIPQQEVPQGSAQGRIFDRLVPGR